MENKSSAGIHYVSSQKTRWEKLLTSERSFCFTVVALKTEGLCENATKQQQRALTISPLSFFPHPPPHSHIWRGLLSSLSFSAHLLSLLKTSRCFSVHINRSGKREREESPSVLSRCLSLPKALALPPGSQGTYPSTIRPRALLSSSDWHSQTEFGAALKPQSKCLSGKWWGE